MALMAFLLQCTAALCCFSVMLHNVWHLGGMAPSPLNPPFPIPNSSPSFHSPLPLLHSISPSLLSPYLHLCLFLLFLVFSTPSPSFSLTRTFFYPCFSLLRIALLTRKPYHSVAGAFFTDKIFIKGQLEQTR